jgi:hypothetical protein
MPNYTERTVLSKPRDFAEVANNAGSGGVVNNNVTETVNNVNVTGSAVSIFNQEFLNTTSNILTWTQNGGILPKTNLSASIHVYQNGQKLIESQYQRALTILTENRDKLDLLAEKLLTAEVLFKEDLIEIFGERPWNTSDLVEIESPEGTIEIETISEETETATDENTATTEINEISDQEEGNNDETEVK